jgi:hypothetical protein
VSRKVNSTHEGRTSKKCRHNVLFAWITFRIQNARHAVEACFAKVTLNDPSRTLIDLLKNGVQKECKNKYCKFSGTIEDIERHSCFFDSTVGKAVSSFVEVGMKNHTENTETELECCRSSLDKIRAEQNLSLSELKQAKVNSDLLKTELANTEDDFDLVIKELEIRTLKLRVSYFIFYTQELEREVSSLKERNKLLNRNVEVLSIDFPNLIGEAAPSTPLVANQYVIIDDARMLEIFNMFTATLNKLTPDLFDRLSNFILNLGWVNEKILSNIVEILFEKALTDCQYGSMYARLCQMLSTQTLRVEDCWLPADRQQRNSVFCRLLADKITRELDTGKNWAVEEISSREQANLSAMRSTLAERAVFLEAADKRNKIKKRALGCVRFVGEIYKFGLLEESIVHQCIANMLRNVNNYSVIQL